MDRLRRTRLWIAMESLLAGSLIVPAIGHAQVSPTDEYKKLITSAQDVTAIGAHPFGEHVNLYTGALSFEVTDISIPGIGPTLTLGRALNTAEDSPDAEDAITGVGGFWRPFGDWDLGIPRIQTNAAWQMGSYGWVVGVYSKSRCTQFGVPPPVPSTSPPDFDWQPERWWYGYHLIIPGAGEQTLLASYDGQKPTDGKTYSIGTKQNWVITCGVTASDGGEGFLATAPDGTRYTFAHLVYRPMPWISRPTGSTGYVAGSVHPMKNDADYLARYDAAMYVTQIKDRFGNTITYNWNGNNLTSIVASDGREIDLTYQSSSSPLIASVTEKAFSGAPTRTWFYTYGGASVLPTLTRVQLPDGHAWSYQIGNLESTTLNTQGGTCTALPGLTSGPATGTMASPSGLTASFTIAPKAHGRSYVPKACWSPYSGSTTTYATIPNEYYQFSITEEDLSGPGLPAGAASNNCKSGVFCWKYSYSPPNQSWTSDPCAANKTCATTVYTDVTDPLGQDVRYTFSNRFDASETLLLRTNDYSGAAGSTILRSEANTYANPTGGPWPTSYGISLQSRTNHAQIEEVSPLQTRTSTQDGVTFTSSVNSFDSFARATSTKGSSSLGYSKTDTTTYQNDTNLWVLGLTTSTATNGIYSAQTTYDSHDLPNQHYVFGRLDSTNTWNSNGTLASITDGDSHATTFSNWYRGVPEKLTYADGHSQSATVNGAGWITSITDENGYITNYAYDTMGRLTQISYPTGDDVAWNVTSLSFAPVAASELGIASGHWKQVVHTGNDYSVTYFDAYWRPLVSDHYDNANFAGTLSRTITRYDADGRKVFTSYPTRSNAAYTASVPGTQTSYDALARATKTLQDWELDSTAGPLLTTYQYLSGFKTEITDPNNNSTITSYMAYAEPATDWPVSISAPAGEITTIQRDAFGKPLSVTRTGIAAGSPSVTRFYTYNSFQQLCGRTDPETGTTAFGYDGADNLTWSASGLTANTSGCYSVTDASPSGRMASRTYDARNRLTAITYPDGSGNATFQYAPDGALTLQTLANNGSTVTTSYAYDKRRLLIGEGLSVPGAATFSLGYGHDVNGHLSSTAYPDGRTITYLPNALGQPTAAHDVGANYNYVTNATYYPDGEIASFTYGSGAPYTMTENQRGLVDSIADGWTCNPTNLDCISQYVGFSYAYDGDGNVAAITDNAGSIGNVDMSYDGLDRLKQAVSPMFGSAGADTATYTYDVLDNLTSATVGSYSSFSYVYNTANQLSQLISGGSAAATYLYDAQGNLASKNGQAYQFDAANRLRSVAGAANYLYDASGRRVQKMETSPSETLDSDYSQDGRLMNQWNPADADSTDYIYISSTLVARVETNAVSPPPPSSGKSAASSNDRSVRRKDSEGSS